MTDDQRFWKDAANAKAAEYKREIERLERELAESTSRKVCHVCGDSTELCCSDCKIDFGASVYVCHKPECRDKHEEKCSARVRDRLAKLTAPVTDDEVSKVYNLNPEVVRAVLEVFLKGRMG